MELVTGASITHGATKFDFVEVCSIDQMNGPGFVVMIAGNGVALFRSDTRVLAIDNTCIRCGSSVAAGTFDGTYVGCSGCDWKYDVATGCVWGVPDLWIDSFEVKISDAKVMVASVCRTSARRG